MLLGPTAVFVTTPGHWVLGVLLNNQLSVGGDPFRPPVNTFLAQPSVNYNTAREWYLTTPPITTSNWLAAPGQDQTRRGAKFIEDRTHRTEAARIVADMAHLRDYIVDQLICCQSTS